jgi:hypothetical protein
MAPTQTIDWSKYQTPAGNPTIDFSKYTGGTAGSGSDAAWDALKDKYGLPHSVDLSKPPSLFALASIPKDDLNKVDLEKWQQAYQEANPESKPTGFLSNAWDELKKMGSSLVGDEGTPTTGVATLPGVGLARTAAQRVEQAKTDLPGALGRTTTDVAAAALPFAIGEGAERLGAMDPMASIKSALGRTLSVEEANAVRSASSSQPALNVTPKDVLTHASQEGIKLTPGQALEDPAATNIQKMGATAMVGGKDLSLALRDQRAAFVNSTNKLGRTIDPQGVGINDETAGHTIQTAVQKNLDSLKGKASAAYNQVSAQQQDLTGNLRSLYGLADERQFEEVTDPQTGEKIQRPIYQSPATQAALDDIQDAPKRLGNNPSIASMRSLRSEFWEKGNDYTGNIPKSAQALYKNAAKAVDQAIVEAGTGTPFEPQLRAADAQWKHIQDNYNEPGQPLSKILQQDDPTKIVSQLQNAPAQDITMLRKELNDGPAIQALRRTVLNDISNNKFTVRNDGLGGYSHEYLNALYGPDVTKQLYLKADLARRIGYDANPSGTGSAMSVLEQGGNIKAQPKLTAFAKLSMPRDPLQFLPQRAVPAGAATTFATPAAQPVSPITGGPIANPAQLFQRQGNP